jgi:hypothetical protein
MAQRKRGRSTQAGMTLAFGRLRTNGLDRRFEPQGAQGAQRSRADDFAPSTRFKFF